MEFTKALIKGKLIKRYKRFFADIKLDKEIVTAHCPNTGLYERLVRIREIKFLFLKIMIQKESLNTHWKLSKLRKI